MLSQKLRRTKASSVSSLEPSSEPSAHASSSPIREATPEATPEASSSHAASEPSPAGHESSSERGHGVCADGLWLSSESSAESGGLPSLDGSPSLDVDPDVLAEDRDVLGIFVGSCRHQRIGRGLVSVMPQREEGARG